MRDLGIEADIESYGAERIAALYGTAPGKYVQGLFVTGDAIIDSTRYVQAIARAGRDALPGALARGRAARGRR